MTGVLRTVAAGVRVLAQGLRYAFAGRHLTLLLVVAVVPVAAILVGLLVAAFPVVLYPFI